MLSTEQIRQRVEELGEWFHNLDLGGVQTAPDHFLGDYPQIKWRQFSSAIPEDLIGKSVLDVGCNGGFYSIQMKRRGVENFFTSTRSVPGRKSSTENDSSRVCSFTQVF